MKAACGCGCGGYPKMTQSEFCAGHWSRTPEGIKNNSEAHLKGLPVEHGDGYLIINAGIGKGNRLHHRMIAEQMLGRPLLDTEIVHHDDENRGNNDPSNLVICKDNAEHQRIHLQKRALKECGHADWRKCNFCKQWDDTKNLTIRTTKKGQVTIEHQKCGNAYRAEWLRNKKAKMRGAI